eukprot:COSAG02_NODE_1598_length_11761_cov_15.902418_7_plen_118_part_00
MVLNSNTTRGGTLRDPWVAVGTLNILNISVEFRGYFRKWGGVETIPHSGMPCGELAVGALARAIERDPLDQSVIAIYGTVLLCSTRLFPGATFHHKFTSWDPQSNLGVPVVGIVITV